MSVEGVDVSNQNGSVNWRAVRSAGRYFAVCRCSEGDLLDRTLTRQRVAAIRDAGMIAGAYVFLRPRPGRTGDVEARTFWHHARAAGLYTPDRQRVIDVRPVLDVEATAWDLGSRYGRLKTRRYINQAARELRRLTGGRRPIIYTGRWFWDELGYRYVPEDCPLWLAAYTRTWEPHVPKTWDRPLIWQYSGDTAHVPGVPGACDLDRYLGTDGQRGFREKACI